MDTFGEWLRYQRNQLRLTREQFAARVGCSIALLRKIEAGERRPSEQIAELVANCLNIPAEERPTFVKVARGELSVERLSPGLKPVAASKSARTNLPLLPTPLIGRQQEVEHLIQLLRDPQCRLLTLTGPGGIGKTRLAIETAAQVQDTFADSVFFVPLAPVNSTRYIVPVIADAIGFSFQSANRAAPKTQLFSYLQGKHALLLLDNLEHLLAEPGIEVLAELLAIAPHVKLLVTSRETLELQGEWVFEVPGLPVPESRYEPGNGAQSSGQNTSVELFLQRARRAHVEFSATLEDYPAIVHICRLLDGMPLGIELAAAWVRTLSCDEIAQEIERGLGFLSLPARDLPARHRSMRAVFDHSWNLLTEEEQGVLLRLSIFRGGFRREAAEQVSETTLSGLSTLLAKSLIRRSGAGRYDLHELIRQFAAEHLAKRPKEQAEVQARHASYYLTFFGQADGRLRSFRQQETLSELAVEIDNFRTAWDWAVTHGRFAMIEQTLRMLAFFYDIRGWLQEGLDTLGCTAAVLESRHGQAAPDRTNQVALGHTLTARSLLASRLGQYEQAHVMLERSIDLLGPLNEPGVLVESITFLGVVMELTGNYVRALELYSEGLEIATAVGDRWFRALCLTCLAGLAGITQSIASPEVTHDRLQSAVTAWRAIGDPRLTAIALNMLSWNALALGRYDKARDALEESVALGISVGDRYGLGFAYRGLGLIAQAQGDHSEAVSLFHKSLDTLTELGARQDVARVLAEMSWSVLALGADADAGRAWREALRTAIETQGTFIALEALLGLASLQAKQGKPEFALENLMIVLNHPAGFQDTKNRAARLRIELEAKLKNQQVETALARAQVKTFETVIDEVLNGC
jgi:predicted ATPase/transcriptional regulator with XRE-family HTH domain